jgi:hypothetical protein
MLHMFMAINCKKCNEPYCPVCKEECPKCGEVDIADEKTMSLRAKMRAKDKKYIDKYEKKHL